MRRERSECLPSIVQVKRRCPAKRHDVMSRKSVADEQPADPADEHPAEELLSVPGRVRPEGARPATIAAIVVTYDRPEQLRECLAALGRQSQPVDRVYVVDNGAAGSGGPPPLRDLTGSAPLTYLAPARNLGGAGGFCMGIEHAYADGFDWLWLMDDDVVPADDALAALLAAHERMPPSEKPALLASRITGIDGRPHPRHPVTFKHDRRAGTIAGLGYASIRRADFVSVLIARRAVKRYGYPIADYFIWGDDLEYTSRILRHEHGLLVPGSIVCHKAAHEGTKPAPPDRLFLVARNYLWMLLYSPALSFGEKIALTLRYSAVFVAHVFRRRGRSGSWTCIANGFAAALKHRPRSAPPPSD